MQVQKHTSPITAAAKVSKHINDLKKQLITLYTSYPVSSSKQQSHWLPNQQCGRFTSASVGGNIEPATNTCSNSSFKRATGRQCLEEGPHQQLKWLRWSINPSWSSPWQQEVDNSSLSLTTTNSTLKVITMLWSLYEQSTISFSVTGNNHHHFIWS